ncbi:thiol-disulfide oxidoreductase ResA [Acidithrix ferrooxidans]|uniref:Thiol-disulfide oxidoreductase ResA n=1 Tax=Acidithrix ferrooxidans TaxID=1280514 RepID=A0A0D8HFW7_9ACTN|nr:thiol-disulfide oxidoreductase ResA [Acidithrix ferrooxidans]CAG4931201.1 unnamed protein product [Acidithrix sp. C25]
MGGDQRGSKVTPTRVLTLIGVLAIGLLVVFAVLKATSSKASLALSAPGSGVVTSSPLVGHPAPLFSLPSLSNGSKFVSLKSLEGRPLVINFFSPACIPCRQEMPTFASLGGRYAGKINFVGVDETSSSSAALSFVNSFRIPYPTVIDANGDLVGPYLIPGVPVTVFVGSNGVIKGYVAGAISKSTLIARTNALA